MSGLDRAVIVLVEPQYPGNVGAAARAMKNFGLRRLVIVDPPAFDAEQARWMAPGCADLIAEMRIVATLDEALEGVHRVVASTARHRKQGQPVHTPERVATDLFDDDDGVTAILFGREDFGLSTEHVRRCHAVLRIPTPEHASLNLGQAVLVVARTLFEEARSRGMAATGRTLGGSRAARTTAQVERTSARDRRAELGQIEPAVAEMVALLERVGYTRAASPDKVAVTGRQALQQAGVSIRHVEALRGMVSRLQWALDNPDVDWTAPRKQKKG